MTQTLKNTSGNQIILTIDCRELLPPEPLVRVLEALNVLEENQTLRMLHRQKPCLLFDKLDERKLRYHLTEFEDGSIELDIWKDPA
ncbi:MAG: DUF2249 domain-containing protein [SAR324 cluster bacterium]|nr:DUF2249 domain-containing protein [SAR324 cluster bacterium]